MPARRLAKPAKKLLSFAVSTLIKQNPPEGEPCFSLNRDCGGAPTLL